jgi:hypothetical protein
MTQRAEKKRIAARRSAAADGKVKRRKEANVANAKKAAERIDEKNRPEPQEILSATARIPKADLDSLLRSESGTRAAVSREEIARHIEAKLQNEAPTAPPPDDPQARPTIDVSPLGKKPLRAPAIVEPPPSSTSLQTPPPMVLTPARAIILPSPAPSPVPPPRSRTPRWVAPVIVAGAMFFTTLTIALGFLLGRLSGH